MNYNTYYRRFNTTIKSSTEVNYFDLTHVCKINEVSDDARPWICHDVVISIGGIFSKNTLYVAWHTKKLWAFSDLVAAISAALHETFVRSKYANSVSQFLLYWMRIICCIYKDFVRQLKAFLPSFCHLCACEMSPGWGHLITWIDPSVGHLNGILARLGGNLKKVKCLGGWPGGMLKLRFWPIHQMNVSGVIFSLSSQRDKEAKKKKKTPGLRLLRKQHRNHRI